MLVWLAPIGYWLVPGNNPKVRVVPVCVYEGCYYITIAHTTSRSNSGSHRKLLSIDLSDLNVQPVEFPIKSKARTDPEITQRVPRLASSKGWTKFNSPVQKSERLKVWFYTLGWCSQILNRIEDFHPIDLSGLNVQPVEFPIESKARTDQEITKVGLIKRLN